MLSAPMIIPSNEINETFPSDCLDEKVSTVLYLKMSQFNKRYHFIQRKSFSNNSSTRNLSMQKDTS
jgi:hypothetical protein